MASSELLKQIQAGKKLNRTETYDRSAPNIGERSQSSNAKLPPGAPQLGLFAGGVPKLPSTTGKSHRRHTNAPQNLGAGGRPPQLTEMPPKPPINSLGRPPVVTGQKAKPPVTDLTPVPVPALRSVISSSSSPPELPPAGGRKTTLFQSSAAPPSSASLSHPVPFRKSAPQMENKAPPLPPNKLIKRPSAASRQLPFAILTNGDKPPVQAVGQRPPVPQRKLPPLPLGAYNSI